ncbi:MAG: YIP1 family protein [Terriglobales bacterium]|jgi:Yip1-like protein
MATNPSVRTRLPQEPAPLSEGQRIGYIFFAPSRVFADLRRNASWLAPFLIVAVVSLLFFYVVDRKVSFPKVVENLIRLQPKQADRIDRLPADQRDKVMAQRVTITKIVSYAVPVITLVLYAVFAGVLFATLKFSASADVKYKTLFAVVVYSRLPELLGFLLATLSLLAGVGRDAFNIENPLALNPGYFIGPSGSPVLRALLTPLDAITIWTLVLTAIGITHISKVKRGTAFAVVFGWSAFVVLARVALAAATS